MTDWQALIKNVKEDHWPMLVEEHGLPKILITIILFLICLYCFVAGIIGITTDYLIPILQILGYKFLFWIIG